MGLFDRFFGPPTEDKFAEIIMAAFRRIGETQKPTYDKAGFRLVFEGEESRVVNLRNLFTEYCNAPKETRKAWLDRATKGLANRMEMPNEFEDVKPDLMPTVRPRSILDTLAREAQSRHGNPVSLPWCPVSEHLLILFVYDVPNSMRFVTQDDFASWGLSEYEVLEVALENLRQRPFPILSLECNLYIIESGDAYDGTRLLMTDQMRRLELNGDPVAMPITRDCLMVTGSEETEGLAAMATIAEQKLGDARPLCPVPVALRGDEWETWLPPEDHPAFKTFRMLELKYLYGEYKPQQERLEKQNERTGTDVFVGIYDALERDGKMLSYCLWIKGIVSWIPKADLVVLNEPDTKAIHTVPWDRLVKVAGDLMKPMDCHPPRWVVKEFPSDEAIVRMEPIDRPAD